MSRYHLTEVVAREVRAHVAEKHADREWLEWARAAVSRGVRLDVKPASLLALPQFEEVEVAPGVRVVRGGSL